ncbi:DJ-1/PfpI family protein [Brucepastera parasyntrophica]|uniref:DJ-1/PfpI family protein n=1 Tax=Brucepastera parasyntrophica TaxID=2880008 RepID=UPI00210E91DC|nr:DJ-1/PfpI family protein [Brucepastera parasyntrophica]ULQ58575.1 DJ-1/PfpI family protein [Brucepastera parasyntrophica]
MNVNCLLFNDFETLDLFGPVEVFGKVEGYNINYYSINGGNIISAQNAQINTENVNAIGAGGILIIPGGKGTRKLVHDNEFIQKLKYAAEKSEWCLTVCTGSALLAKTGLLDNRNATSNKIAFEWVKSNGKNVNWKYTARWVADKKYYTSSGISAGIDMSLGFIFDRFGEEKVNQISNMMEYEWKNDKDHDPFAV